MIFASIVFIKLQDEMFKLVNTPIFYTQEYYQLLNQRVVTYVNVDSAVTGFKLHLIFVIFCSRHGCFCNSMQTLIWIRKFLVRVRILQNSLEFIPVGKVNNRNSRTRCEIYSKSTIKTPERRQRCSSASIVHFEQENADWDY